MFFPAVLPPAADQVVALFDLVQEKSYVVGVVLQVGVDGYDDLAAGEIESRREGAVWPKFLRKRITLIRGWFFRAS